MTAAEFRMILLEEIPDCSKVQEIRIRAGRPVFVLVDGVEHKLKIWADSGLIRNLLEVMAKHSLYAYEDEIRQGFLTVEGGHRVGIAGKVVLEGSQIRTIKDISGLNIRMSHECHGCADAVLPWIYHDGEIHNTLIISPPGGGKTTMLREVIRLVSNGSRYGRGRSVSVVDERSEIGACFRGVPRCDLGIRTDVMDGCPKALGMLMMIRSMGPEVLAVDEIGTRADLEALREVLKCGVRLFATAHGHSLEDIKRKPILGDMIREGMFERYLVLEGRRCPGTVEGIYDENGASLVFRKSNVVREMMVCGS